MEEIKNMHHQVIPTIRYGQGDPTIWILRMEQYFRDKDIPPKDHMFVASFTLDRPALTYYFEFVRMCSSYGWLAFLNHLKIRLGKLLDTNSEASNQPITVVRQPAMITITTLNVEEEQLPMDQQFEEEHQKILHEFLTSPQTKLEDTYSEPFSFIEEIKNNSNTVIAGSNEYNIDIENSADLFDLSDDLDSHISTSIEKLCISDEAEALTSLASVMSIVVVQNVYNTVPFKKTNFQFLVFESILLKAAPTFAVFVHEKPTWIIRVFDPGGLNNTTHFSLDVVFPRQILGSSFSTNEEPFLTPILIFDPGGRRFQIVKDWGNNHCTSGDIKYHVQCYSEDAPQTWQKCGFFEILIT